MKLISCSSCGVVLDADKLNFEFGERLWNDDGSVNEDKAYSDHNGYIKSKVACPVCSEYINEDGDYAG